MSESVSEIYVLDDDVSVREGVASLIRSVGLKVRTFASTQEFLASLQKERPSCLVLDIQLPDINGFELHRDETVLNLGVILQEQRESGATRLLDDVPRRW